MPVSPGTPSSRSWSLPCSIALGVLLVANHLLYFLSDPGGRMADEEPPNPFVGTILFGGNLGQILEFQYQDFCGGCTADSLLAFPLFALLGPTLFAWKLVPLLFKLVIFAAGTVALRRYVSDLAAVLFGLLLLFAPTYFQHLSMAGLGNHVEIGAFHLVFPLLWLPLFRQNGVAVDRWGLMLAVGAFAGFGTWFCRSFALILPVMVLSALWIDWRFWRSRAPWLVGLGWLVGSAPIWAVKYWAPPSKAPGFAVYGESAGGLLDLSGVVLQRLWALCWGWLPASSLWSALGSRGVAAGTLMTWAAYASLAFMAWYAFRSASWRAAALCRCVLLQALGIGAALVLLGLWDPTHAPPIQMEGLRYLGPLVPLLMLATAITAATLLDRRRPVRMAIAVGLLLVTVGIGAVARIAEWSQAPLTSRPMHLAAYEPTAQIGITALVPYPGALERRMEDREHLFGNDPPAGHIRGFYYRDLGYTLAMEATVRRVTGETEGEFGERIGSLARELPLAERWWFLTGVGYGIPDDGVWRLDALEGPGDSLISFSSALDPSVVRFLLQTQQLRPKPGSSYFLDVVWSIPAVPPPGDDVLRQQIAWGAGRREAMENLSFPHVSPDDGAQVGDLLAEALEAVPPDLRIHAAEGFADRFGELFGYEPRYRQTLLAVAPPDAETGVRRGLLAGAARQFHDVDPPYELLFE